MSDVFEEDITESYILNNLNHHFSQLIGLINLYNL